ncbi:hypothetical protein [Haloarchaeobius amylolyticus]|uniref:hypothetical protein n=1 Tax=Haloarchaeobius amylolyticus TaxID=1198296 RepID=UPI002271E52C|nr:hypothetical protein [Haloarchaeobius amylolyticus]
MKTSQLETAAGVCIAVSLLFAGLSVLLAADQTGMLSVGLLFVGLSPVFAGIVWRHWRTREPALNPFVRRARGVLAYVMLGLGVLVVALTTWLLSLSLTAS